MSSGVGRMRSETPAGAGTGENSAFVAAGAFGIAALFWRSADCAKFSAPAAAIAIASTTFERIRFEFDIARPPSDQTSQQLRMPDGKESKRHRVARLHWRNVSGQCTLVQTITVDCPAFVQRIGRTRARTHQPVDRRSALWVIPKPAPHRRSRREPRPRARLDSRCSPAPRRHRASRDEGG